VCVCVSVCVCVCECVCVCVKGATMPGTKSLSVCMTLAFLSCWPHDPRLLLGARTLARVYTCMCLSYLTHTHAL
jgi:hypothetical protein